METEYVFTGYCRTTDQSRMVEVITTDGQLSEVDCCYESCLHASSCAIAKEIDALKSQN